MLIDIVGSEVAYSTYLGGSRYESSTRMAVYGGEVVFLAGYCGSYDFPITPITFQDSLQGSSDGFVVMINFDSVVPVADAGIDIIARKDDMVQLNGSGSWDGVGIVNWSWFFGPAFDFEIQYGPYAHQIFTEVGVFPVTLEVFDRTSNFDSDVIYVLVLEELDDAELEMGNMLRFGSHEYRDCPESFQWTWAVDLNFTQRTVHGPFANFTFEYPGVYSVVRNVSVGSNNSFEDEMTVAVLGSTGSLADAGADVSVDQGEAVFFNGLATKMGITEWEWTFTYGDEDIILNGPVIVFTFNTSGTYDITLRVRDIRNLDSFDTMTVTVQDITHPVAVAGGDKTIDQGRMVTLDGSMSTDDVEVVSWTFSFQYQGMEVVVRGPIDSFRFDYPGDYSVLLTVADAAGNTATDSMTVIVRDTVPPNAYVGNDVTVGQNTTLRFEDDNSTDNYGLARWTWSFTYDEEMVELTGQQVTHLFVIAGVYEVNLTVIDEGGLSDSGLFTVTILDTTEPVADAGQNRSTEAGKTIILDGSNSTDNVGIVRWSWSFYDDDGYKRLDQEVAMYKFTSGGSYNITLTVVDAEGNTATDMIVVSVEEAPSEGGTAWALFAVIAVILLAVVAVGFWATSKRRKV
jgi:PKD repeat protein